MRSLKSAIVVSFLVGLSVSPSIPSIPTNPEVTLLAQSSNEPDNSQGKFRRAFAYEAVTLDATAGGVAFTAATYAPTVTDQPSAFSRAELAVVNCNNAQARYRVDSAAAVTASVGMLIQDGDWFLIYGYNNIAAFRGIRTGATSVVCDVTYYRNR